MSGKVTMATIAKKLGVSKNTVSLALRGTGGISEKTRRLVVETAARMGYSYKSSGKSVPESRNLCLVIPRSTQASPDFFSSIQMGIEDEAKKSNMNTILHYYDDTGEDPQIPNCIREGMISGIITLGRVSRNMVLKLKATGLPVVMVDNYFDDMEADCVLTDNHCGGYAATGHLIANGHRNIAFFGEIHASVSFYDRYMGYRKALENAGLTMPLHCAALTDCPEIVTAEELAELLRHISVEGDFPTGFVCCNDAAAITLCKALKQMGVDIPGEVSVIGFDDISGASQIEPELTTMRVRREYMGRKAVNMLLARISGSEGITGKLLLPATLVERHTVKRMDV
ncbi:MAG TPA: LacI family DNA-binding transcriptional regulator [Clostridiales bacterium]|nr:LacI family DNA-binding transcriptional regulator [Clostridiales bacterium]